MSDSRTKYPIKSSIEATDAQDAFAAKVAAHLTEQRASGRRVSKKAAWRLFNDHCQTCLSFLTGISMDRTTSTDDK